MNLQKGFFQILSNHFNVNLNLRFSIHYHWNVIHFKRYFFHVHNFHGTTTDSSSSSRHFFWNAVPEIQPLQYKYSVSIHLCWFTVCRRISVTAPYWMCRSRYTIVLEHNWKVYFIICRASSNTNTERTKRCWNQLLQNILYMGIFLVLGKNKSFKVE